MFKKIAITTSVLIVGGLLTWGGINRTQARASLATEPRGEQIAAAEPGAGQGRGWAELTPAARPAQGDASAAPEERLRQGAGQQRGGGASRIDGALPSGSRGSFEAESIVPKAWRSLMGTVTEIDAAHLTLRLADGIEVIVEGRPWRYASESGFAPALGDQLQVRGFDEDGEFKPGVLENLTQPHALTLRNADGQPAWRGLGR